MDFNIFKKILYFNFLKMYATGMLLLYTTSQGLQPLTFLFLSNFIFLTKLQTLACSTYLKKFRKKRSPQQ